MKKTLLSILALTVTNPAFAELCKYVDDAGRITYSDTPVHGARKLTCLGPPPPPPMSAPASRDERTPTQATPPAPSVQDIRREELSARLAAEEEQLQEARRQLAEQESVRHGDERNYQRVLDRLKPYQEKVQQLERSVTAIRAELATLP